MSFKKNKYVIDIAGFCPICQKNVRFNSEREWLRDSFLCSNCGSIPRERALIKVLDMYFPNYRNLKIHESSPCGRGASIKLNSECSSYSASHYFPDIAPGEIHAEHGYRCENLESLSFESNSFDLFITQDVMEHILEPAKAYSEIARVLKPGGAHVFTVPIINKNNKSECWASRDENGEIIHHHEPEYHGNPIDNKGSLVTIHWGYDVAEFIQCHAATPTTIVMIDDINMGIRAEYIEVLVSRKYDGGC